MAKSQAAKKAAAKKTAQVVVPIIQAAITEAAQSSSDEPETEYTIVEPVRHDGIDYAPGESIELSEDEAAPLLAVRAIKPVVVEETK